MFLIALTNVLVTLFFIVPGFILGKTKIAKTEHLSTLGALLLYVGTPFLEVSAFLSLDDPDINDIVNMGIFFVATLVVMLLFIMILYFIFRKKYNNDASYRVMTAASVMGNLGFFGLPVIKSLYPSNPIVASYSQIYMLTMNLILYSIGVYCLTGDKKYMSIKKALINPTVFGFIIAFIFYIFKLKNYLPTPLISAINSLGNMTTPLCMIILGIRLAYIPFKQLLTNKRAYLTTFLKLLAFPVFAFLIVYFIPLDNVLKGSLVILSAVPCAAVILSMAEIHHSEEKMSANVIILTTILSFITIPLITLLVGLF